MKRSSVFLILSLIMLSWIIVSCHPKQDPEQKKISDTLRNLYREIENQEDTSHFFDEIFVHIRSLSSSNSLIPLLSTHIHNYPHDPYLPAYHFFIGEIYLIEDNLVAALPHLRITAHGSSDMKLDEQSLRLLALKRLQTIETNTWWLVSHLDSMLQDFSSEIDKAQLYYHLGQTYAELGRWNAAYNAYRDFLASERSKSLSKNVYNNVLNWVEFYHSDRDWTHENLLTLVRSIQGSLRTKNISRLLSHRAKRLFFTMSWNQEMFDENSTIRTFNIGAFLSRSSVQYARNLEVISNDREAYLRTWGWTHRIPVWYLYFRRINFPADPGVHGNWEWAGIFFGDSL